MVVYYFDDQLSIPVLTWYCTIDDLALRFVNVIILSISLKDPEHTWPSIYKIHGIHGSSAYKNSWHSWTEFSFYKSFY